MSCVLLDLYSRTCRSYRSSRLHADGSIFFCLQIRLKLHMRTVATALLLPFFCAPAISKAQENHNPASCHSISDSNERLHCYDDLYSAGSETPQASAEPPPKPDYTEVSVIDVESNKGSLEGASVKITGWLTNGYGTLWFLKPEPHSSILLSVDVKQVAEELVKGLLRECDNVSCSVIVTGRAVRESGRWSIEAANILMHRVPAFP